MRKFIQDKNYEDADVWNMDQTAVVYDMDASGSKGRKESLQEEKGWWQQKLPVTVFLTSRAAGKKLETLIVLPARPGGTIETKEIPTVPKDVRYTVQEEGWTNERVMLFYLSNVLGPAIKRRNRPQLLLLDAFSVHLTEIVRSKMVEMGIQWMYVPEGATSVCQPLDCVIMRMFKARMREKCSAIWHEKAWGSS